MASPLYPRAEASAGSDLVALAVDCMGGDHGPAVTLPACRAFLRDHPQASLVLVGLPSLWAQAADLCALPNVRSVDAASVVAMDDTVETALRRKRDSTLRVAIEQVRDGHADAVVSAGNTGALMAIARYVLKTLAGIDRPAIAAQMPNITGGATTVLDLGANVDCSAEHLLQFAVMGSALLAATGGQARPSVGLLNVGEEAIKGGETIKRAGELLRAAGQRGEIHFIGNVEGDDIFKGSCDIIVCDGFVGNVALKASEGVAGMLFAMIKAEYARGPLSRLAALVSLPVLARLKKRVDHRRYNGAALLGLRGLVFKSHGSADAYAFECALRKAYDAAQHRLLARVQAQTAHAAGWLAQQRAPGE